MEKSRGTKGIAVAALCVAVLGLSVAFAAMSSTLNISGTAEVNPARWDVQFTNVTNTPSGSATATSPTTTGLTINDTTASLTRPGDSVTYTYTVTNNGDIPAYLESYTAKTLSDLVITGTAEDATQKAADEATVRENLEFSFTDGNGNAIVDGSANKASTTLTANQSTTYKMTITYKSSANALPSAKVNITIPAIGLQYSQAD